MIWWKRLQEARFCSPWAPPCPITAAACPVLTLSECLSSVFNANYLSKKRKLSHTTSLSAAERTAVGQLMLESAFWVPVPLSKRNIEWP